MSKSAQRSNDLLIIFRCLNSALAGQIQFTIASCPFDFKVKILAGYSCWRNQYGVATRQQQQVSRASDISRGRGAANFK